MKTRTGKIGRLSFEIREEINRRLRDGQMSGPLLHWLNELPEVQQVLSELFEGKPINKQNLTDWRRGGFQDWLRHQDRQRYLHQLVEQGEDLHRYEGGEDLFENFSRILIAELAEDIQSLRRISNRTERWKRLRSISRELARLQNGYNNSKRTELLWEKWNDSGPDLSSEPDIAPETSLLEEKVKVNQGETKGGAQEEPQTGAYSSESFSLELKNPKPTSVTRIIFLPKCDRGCVCKNCHPNDGDYPHAEAVKDEASSSEAHSSFFTRAGVDYWITRVECRCYCDCPKN